MAYQSLSKLGQLVEEINNAIDEGLDDAEINELIAVYSQAQEDEAESINAAMKFCDLETEMIDDKINALKNEKERIANRKEYLRNFFIEYINQFGESNGKTKRIKGVYFTFTRQLSKSIRSDLNIVDVPNKFLKYRVNNWLDGSTFNKVCDKLEGDINFDEEIRKAELSKYAKENNLEDKYLEEKPFLKIT